ncbi:MAG TPA: hypothetical protein VN673_09885 [Clostridia bacterium]|nr:hypothetical protein [Clostridia bacterium]
MRLCVKRNKSGSVLVMTLILAAILGVTLGGYLYWVRTQNLLVAQSQAWNAAMAMAEAGVEEAMSQINTTFGTNYHSSALTNFGPLTAGAYGPRSNSLGGGSYAVLIIPTNPGPTIIATGYAHVPILSRPVQRVVRVTTTTRPAFDKAMVALLDIVFNGNNITVDSFDSTDPLHSNMGGYSRSLRKAGGEVVSTFGTINVNNANINGKLLTGPSGTFNLGPNGFAGDLNFTGPGIQDGWHANDFNMEIDNVQPPDTSSFVTPTLLTTGTNKYELSSGGYIINGELKLTGDSILVTGDVTLYVAGNLTMLGTSVINIEPGANLTVYVAGEKATFTQVNTTGYAGSFSYYGLPTNKSLSWTGNAEYKGSIYAPQAVFTCGGGGSTEFDYQGACVVKEVTLNGHFNFHYDEGLRLGKQSGFVVSSWKEL